MADYIAILDSQIEPRAPVTSELMFQLRDNPEAIAEGSVGATRIRAESHGGCVVGNTVLFNSATEQINVGSGGDVRVVGSTVFRAVATGAVRIVVSTSGSSNITYRVVKNNSTQSTNTASTDVSYVAGDCIWISLGTTDVTLGGSVTISASYRSSEVRIVGGI